MEALAREYGVELVLFAIADVKDDKRERFRLARFGHGAAPAARAFLMRTRCTINDSNHWSLGQWAVLGISGREELTFAVDDLATDHVNDCPSHAGWCLTRAHCS